MWCGFHTKDVWLSHVFVSHVVCGYHMQIMYECQVQKKVPWLSAEILKDWSSPVSAAYLQYILWYGLDICFITTGFK